MLNLKRKTKLVTEQLCVTLTFTFFVSFGEGTQPM